MANWIAMNPNFPDEMPKVGSSIFFTYRETKSNGVTEVRRIFYDQHGKRLISDCRAESTLKREASCSGYPMYGQKSHLLLKSALKRAAQPREKGTAMIPTA